MSDQQQDQPTAAPISGLISGANNFNPVEHEDGWYDMPSPADRWLVDGLIPSDDVCGFIGKPKSGKSTAIRNLAVAVIKGDRKFLGRNVALPPNTGKVLYVHLDRKDKPHQVIAEFKRLGVTREAHDRLRFLSARHFPEAGTYDSRCQWLARHIKEFTPNLVVLDMLLQFVKTPKGANDYDGMVEALNKLQDKLREANYAGVLLASFHARKALGDDPTDSLLGSTGTRGCISTGLYFRQYKKMKVYTVLSDQTQRSDEFGEMEETIVNREAGTGIISLGGKFDELRHETKKDEYEVRRQKLLRYLVANPKKTLDEIAAALNMAKNTVLSLLEAMMKGNLVTLEGVGKKGSPKLYSATKVLVNGKAQTDDDAKKSREEADAILNHPDYVPWDQLPICLGCRSRGSSNKVAGKVANREWGDKFCSQSCCSLYGGQHVN